MKPGDHPDFFRLAPPSGHSRESSLRLDAAGRFWHDGAPVEHPGIAAGLHRWITRHPENGRYILANGYDWTYFTVDDVPFFVDGIRPQADGIVLHLSDGSDELWNPSDSWVSSDDVLRTEVKRGAPGGPYVAAFSRHAQASLAPFLVLQDGEIKIALGDRRFALAGNAPTSARGPDGPDRAAGS